MSFIDYILECNSKKAAAWNIIIFQILSSIGLEDVDIYLTDGPIESDIAMITAIYILQEEDIGFVS